MLNGVPQANYLVCRFTCAASPAGPFCGGGGHIGIHPRAGIGPAPALPTQQRRSGYVTTGLTPVQELLRDPASAR